MKLLLAMSMLLLAQTVQAGIIFPVCKAQNARGMVFTAQAILSRQAAQAEAINKCYRFGSRICRPLGCR